MGEDAEEIIFKNMHTLRYSVVLMWDPDHVSVTDKDDLGAVIKLKEKGYPIVRTAKVDSDTYKEWIDKWHPKGDVLPHIQFGGAIKAIPGGDGGRGYTEWREYAKTLT